MKRSSLVRMAIASTLALPLGVLGAQAPAHACGTEVFTVVDRSAEGISSAERALSQGRQAVAATSVFKVFPKLRSTPVGKSPLTDRALRIVALAAVRTDGALTVGQGVTWPMAGGTPDQREANLMFSISTLRQLNEKRANNPSLQTDLAEALGKVARFKGEAFTLLLGLAKKDLIASAEGYATLARLHDVMGEPAPRDAAVKRCEGMTKAPQTCQVPVSPATTSS